MCCVKAQQILTLFWLLTGGSETGTTLNMIVPQDMAYKWQRGKNENSQGSMGYWGSGFSTWSYSSACPGLMVTSPLGLFYKGSKPSSVTQNWE